MPEITIDCRAMTPVSCNKAYADGSKRRLTEKGREWKLWIAQHVRYFARPTLDEYSKFRVNVQIQFQEHPKRRRDARNYDKLILDALTGIICGDDSQVIDGRTSSTIGPDWAIKLSWEVV